jgi:hypothetical protein
MYVDDDYNRMSLLLNLERVINGGNVNNLTFDYEVFDGVWGHGNKSN